jgi:hypothetical protein
MKPTIGLLMMILAMTGASFAADKPNAFPYSEFAKAAAPLQGEVIDGVESIPLYLKALKAGDKIDCESAHFRIQMADGKIQPLRCDPLPEKPEEGKSPADQSRIRAGFTHKLWVPKDPKKYEGAVMYNDLPAGYLDIQFPSPARASDR